MAAMMRCAVMVQDLTYSVKSHHDKKVTLNLLSSVSGFFNSGEMSALVRQHVLLHDAQVTVCWPGKLWTCLSGDAFRSSIIQVEISVVLNQLLLVPHVSHFEGTCRDVVIHVNH